MNLLTLNQHAKLIIYERINLINYIILSKKINEFNFYKAYK